MRAFAILAAAATLSTIAGVSFAGTIASPAIYGAFTQASAACVIRNVGTGPIEVEADIFDESGNVVPPTSRSCTGNPIQPGRTCDVFVEPIANGVAFACSATATSSRKLRGTLILSTAGRLTIRSADLR
jgi:hypothetical protein